MVAHIEPAVEFKVWQAIQGGVDMLILRAKEDSVGTIKTSLSNLRTSLGKGFPIIVNAGNRFAKLPEASGYHLPEIAMRDDVAKEELAKVSGKATSRSKAIGISVHSVESAKEAEAFHPDYLLAGTIFETRSHPGEAAGGVERLRAICEATSVPVIAIGGITPENAADCIRAGAIGIAAFSPFKGAGREALGKAYKKAMFIDRTGTTGQR